MIKAFVQERHEIGRFHKANDSLMDQNITAARVLALNMPLVMLILNFGVVAALGSAACRLIGARCKSGR